MTWAIADAPAHSYAPAPPLTLRLRKCSKGAHGPTNPDFAESRYPLSRANPRRRHSRLWRREIVPPDRIYPIGERRSRSEEQTSELQSLMRNSYAVFCLKK